MGKVIKVRKEKKLRKVKVVVAGVTRARYK